MSSRSRPGRGLRRATPGARLTVGLTLAAALSMGSLLTPSPGRCEDLTGLTSVAPSGVRTSLDRRTREMVLTATVTVTNVSQRILLPPLHAVLEASIPGVRAIGLAGGPEDPVYGTFYQDLGSLAGADGLTPGESVSFPVKLAGPGRWGYGFRIEGEVQEQVSNTPPTLAGPAQLQVEEGSPLAFAVIASDSDADDSASLTVSGLPEGASFDLATGTFAWTPDYQQSGDYTPVFIATDRAGAETRLTTRITVLDRNRPPAITPVQDQATSEGTELTVVLSASDPDSPESLTLTAPTLPSGAALDPATSSLRWTPGFDQAGVHPVTVRVTDAAGAFAEVSFDVQVADVNRAPAFTSEAPTEARAGEPFAYAAAVADPDGDALGFGLTTQAVGVELDPTNGAVTWLPDPAQVGVWSLRLRADDGRGGSAEQSFTLTVSPPPNAEPVILSVAPATVELGAELTYDVEAQDSDGDPLAFSLDEGPAGMAIDPTSGRLNWTPTPAQAGIRSVAVRVSDGRGGSATQRFDLEVIPPAQVTLTDLDLSPPGRRLTRLGETLQIQVTGRFNDGSAEDRTASAAGTRYRSSNPYVARVDSEGLVTGLGNGSAVITAESEGLAATAEILVESGVTLDVLTLSPEQATLRLPGESLQLEVTGSFSDGERDLTAAATGTTYAAVPTGVLTLGADGRVSAVADGSATVTARNGDAEASATITVALSAGPGFLFGRTFDDSRGLPLGGVTASLLEDGGGVTDPTPAIIADGHGEYQLQGLAGGALVRLAREGYTEVFRRATIAPGGAIRILDARLTPLGTQSATIGAAVGGEARDPSGNYRLSLPSGALAEDAELAVTPVGPQGLMGKLPNGWTPVAAVDLRPRQILARSALIQVPNLRGLPAGRGLQGAYYDTDRQAWVALEGARVSDDAATLSLPLSRVAQVAFLLPDSGQGAPALAVAGEPLPGVVMPALPADIQASGSVMPPAVVAAPDARGVGALRTTTGSPLPSGFVLSAGVGEAYDLLGGTRVLPRPFTQDLVLYADPPGAVPASHGADFAVSPSRAYGIDELAYGRIRIAVQPVPPAPVFNAIGSAGGRVQDAAGNRAELPAGASTGAIAVQLTSLAESDLPLPVPAGLEFLGGLRLGFGGRSLAASAELSIIRPAGVQSGASLFIAAPFVDPQGRLRPRIVALGRVEGSRIRTIDTLDGFDLPGIRTGGDYLFLRASTPLGLVAGGIDGAAVAPAQVLITSDGAPFADLTDTAGAYLVAGPIGTPTNLSAQTTGGDIGSGRITVDRADRVAALELLLMPVGPSVTTIEPGDGTTGVGLGVSPRLLFSEPLDPERIGEQSVTLTRASDGTAVPVARRLSADRRTLTLVPDSLLTPATEYRLGASTALTDAVGNPLDAPVAVSFVTQDDSAPARPQAGQIRVSLPDAEGFVTVEGTQGTAEADTPVTLSNLTTSTTVTVLALTDGDGTANAAGGIDGSFRIRIPAEVGDALALSFRDGSGNEQTLALTQLGDDGGAAGIGTAGGGFGDGAGRRGSILPGALDRSGVFALSAADARALPALPDGWSLIDTFTLDMGQARFRRLASLRLADTGGLLPRQETDRPPFVLDAEGITPDNLLVNGTLGFNAVAEEADGERATIVGRTLAVAAAPDETPVTHPSAARFPRVLLRVPAETTAGRLTRYRAVAPAARVDLTLVAPSGLDPALELLLVRLDQVAGEPLLMVVDRLERFDDDGTAALRTSGHAYPGAERGGQYAVVGFDPSTAVLGEVSGRIAGPSAIARLEGTPFAAASAGTNSGFLLPVPAGPFDLRLTSGDGALLGSVSGDGPGDLGSPLAPPADPLRIDVRPGEGWVVGIDRVLELHCSEPIDPESLSPATLFVTDAAGNAVAGRRSLSADGLVVRFQPRRRWAFGETFRYGVTRGLTARSGATPAAPLAGTFATFAPVVIATAPDHIGAALALVEDGSVDTALLAGVDAVATLDLGDPELPVETAALMPAVGAIAVEVIDSSSLGMTPSTTLPGLIGSVLAEGALRFYDIDDPAAPSLLVELDVTGTPSDLGLGEGALHLAVAGQGIRVLDPDTLFAGTGDPTVAVYPATGTADLDAVEVLGDRLVAAGGDGLQVIDRLTREGLWQVDLGGLPGALAAVADVEVDLDGDGELNPTAERFDLVAVGVGEHLQLFRLRNLARPVLAGLVVLPGQVRDIRIDTDLALAFVSLGRGGLALVDLTGPYSLTPLDDDRDGRDDRILGLVAGSGASSAFAYRPALGVGHLATNRGLDLVQVVPVQTEFGSVARDPVAAFTGDEESLAEGGVVFTSDDVLTVSIHAAIGPRQAAYLMLTGSGGALPSLPGGVARLALSNGQNRVSIPIAAAGIDGPRSLGLRVLDTDGETIDALDLVLAVPDLDALTLNELFVEPQELRLTPQASSERLAVGGAFSDGRVYNLLAAPGTGFASGDPVVVGVDTSGLVSARAAGATEVLVSYGQQEVAVPLGSELAPVLTGILLRPPLATLRGPGATLDLDLQGVYSDGVTGPLEDGVVATFGVTEPGVASVDAAGRVTALGEGQTGVRVDVDAFSAEVEVAVELSPPTDLDGIVLLAPPVATTDDPSLSIRARISGSGPLAGQQVRFAATGAIEVVVEAVTNARGLASVRLPITLAGAVQLRAVVTDPAEGEALSAEASATVSQGSADLEPNDSPADAGPLALDQGIAGTLGDGDRADHFRIFLGVPGTLELRLTLSDPAMAEDAALVIRDQAGQELARFSGDALAGPPALDGLPAGELTVSLESPSGAPVEYRLEPVLAQGPLGIDALVPDSGGPGTLVRVQGSGFSPDPAANEVLFAGIRAEVVASGPTEVQALVPANAPDGVVTLISGERQVDGPSFTTGRSEPPQVWLRGPPDPASMRLDPDSDQLVAVNRLLVDFAPSVTAEEAASVAADHGAVINGFLPVLNTYVLDFPGSGDLFDLASLELALASEPGVVAVQRELALPTSAAMPVVDSRDGMLPASLYADRLRLFDAYETIRGHPDFRRDFDLKDVRIGVIDTGLATHPQASSEFQFGSVTLMRTHCPSESATPEQCQTTPSSARFDVGGHGTAMASIIAAANNGAGISGVASGVFKPGEVPNAFDLLVYAATYWDAATNAIGSLESAVMQSAVLAALDHMLLPPAAGFAPHPPDVVNLSFGTDYAIEAIADRDACLDAYRARINLMRNTLFVAAAGQESTDADLFCPAALADQLGHVMAIGAADAAERPAIMRGGAQANGGASMTLVAPGTDLHYVRSASRTSAVQALRNDFYAADYDGSSGAAALVSGTAALLQLIRPDQPKLRPRQVKDILVGTGDDITDQWRTGDLSRAGPTHRLNVLRAVLAVLGARDINPVFVLDDLASNPAGGLGRVVAIDLDPLTGDPDPVLQRLIELKADYFGVEVHGEQPIAIAVSPQGAEAYVLARESSATYGTGVFVVSTESLTATEFMPLEPPPRQPLTIDDNRAGMAVSRDGLVLYVAAGTRILMFDLERGRRIETMTQVPVRGSIGITGRGASPLSDRLQAVTDAVAAGIPDPSGHGRLAGVEIADLVVSADDKTLHAVLSTGSGPGIQPGGVLRIDVDRTKEFRPNTPGRQADLRGFMQSRTPVLSMIDSLLDPSGLVAGDEPTTVAESPDGKYLYLVNGGIDRYRTLLTLNDFGGMIADAYGMTLSATATSNVATGLAGLMPRVSARNTGFSNLLEQIESDLIALTREGATFLNAAGDTGVFDLTPNSAGAETGSMAWFVPRHVGFGWNVSPSGGGRVVNQVRQRSLYAARPYDMAIRPDGRRALIPYLATGNFGVLDLDHQKQFERQPPSGAASEGRGPSPVFATLSDEMFQGLVGVTEALTLDNHHWPYRGVFRANRAGSDVQFNVLSPDEALLNTWAIAYAQNGRFAVATHAGARPPSTLEVELPDYNSDLATRLRIAALDVIDLGEGRYLGRDDGLDRGVEFTPGANVTLKRGGGAISILKDQLITRDLDRRAHLARELPSGERAWFGTTPVCGETLLLGASGYCTESVTSRIYGYDLATAPDERFHRPRALAIQPFLWFSAPRFGDLVHRGGSVNLRWRDGRVDMMELVVFDTMDNDPLTDAPRVVGRLGPFALSERERARRSLSRTIRDLFNDRRRPPQHHRRYRIEARALIRGDRAGDPETLSSERLDVTYEQRSRVVGNPCGHTFRLTVGGLTVGDNHPGVVFGGDADDKVTGSYTLELAAGDPLTSPVVVDLSPNIAVDIVQRGSPTPNGQSITDTFELIFATGDAVAGRRHPTDEIVLQSSFSTRQCGDQIATHVLRLVANSGAAEGCFRRFAPAAEADLCTSNIESHQSYRSALASCLRDAYRGAEPFECLRAPYSRVINPEPGVDEQFTFRCTSPDYRFSDPLLIEVYGERLVVEPTCLATFLTSLRRLDDGRRMEVIEEVVLGANECASSRNPLNTVMLANLLSDVSASGASCPSGSGAQNIEVFSGESRMEYNVLQRGP